MKKTFPLLALAALLLGSCDNTSVDDGTASREPVRMLSRATRNGSQYHCYRYDSRSRLDRIDFFLVADGSARRTMYEDFTYDDHRLSRVEHHVFRGGREEKVRTDELFYDEAGRLTTVRSTGRSETDGSEIVAFRQFQYDAYGRVKRVVGVDGFDAFVYDEDGNVLREDYRLFDAEYEGPLMRKLQFDGRKNPYLGLDPRYPGARYSSPNNVSAWETVSPVTGEPVARGVLVYEYDALGYPVSMTETVASPLTDFEPGTEVSTTEFEYR